MRVSKVSLSLRSSTRSGERRRGASHCHNIVVTGSLQKSSGGGEDGGGVRHIVTLSRRGRDRVITEWWRKSQEGREDEGEGSVMDLMHHTTSSFIPSTYAICAGRYRGKSSNKLTLPEIPHFCNRVRDPFQICFPFPGRHRKYEKTAFSYQGKMTSRKAARRKSTENE